MREIKFRAWEGEIMVYWKMGDNFDGNLLVQEETYIDFDTVQQFTGLKDKNGKEIYEGDIVKHSIREPHEWSGLHEVKFDSGRFVLFGGNPRGIRYGEIFNYYPMNVEIIGNIYENPELINRHC